jgi:isoleucyl-tRNA synthetase
LAPSPPKQATPLKDTLNLPSTRFPMKANLPQAEPGMLARWEAEDLYARIRARRKGSKLFVLHDGPPYANGNIHLGTAMNKVIKDFIVKSKTMAGFDAPYVPGWDCHGLPIEIKVDQQLGARKSSLSAEAVRKACREYAARFVDLHRREFKRLGVFGRWQDPYLTMSPQYEATIAAEILKFLQAGYAYKGLRAVYWCIHDRTALAEAEIEYENHESPSVWVAYPFQRGSLPPGVRADHAFAIAWTTTPWTLPASVALAFHPDLEYSVLRCGEADYIVLSALADATAAKCGLRGCTLVAQFPGRDLENSTFHHPWLDREIRGVLADYITTEQGTGIVHTAPGHGAEDFATGEKYGLPVLSPVDPSGIFFGPDSSPFQGQQVFAANPRIIDLLRERGALLGSEPLVHSYPHCWRCHKPVIFRATEQWFIGLDRLDLRRRALDAIEKSVHWDPSWGRERMAGMVATRPDWCISRQRVWGVPIPVLACSSCGRYLRDPKVDERIVAVFADEGSDAWFIRPAAYFVPPDVRCECGGSSFAQERDIVDVWFESGSSQAAVLGHSPEMPWPADLYMEGPDQYRGWFQSSLLVAMGTRGQPPYRGVLSHGWTLDAEGRTMSKSLGTGIEPDAVVSRYGADVLRLWVAAADFRDDVRISEPMLERLAEAYRKIRNTFRFLLGNLNGFDPLADSVPDSDLWELDLYMLKQTALLSAECRAWYDEFLFHKVFHRLYEFCAVQLSAFYLDVPKDRLYTSAPRSVGRRSAQTVLWRILEILVRLFEPLLPFTADEVWSFMPSVTLDFSPRVPSVHLDAFADTSGWQLPGAAFDARWQRLLEIRDVALKSLEAARHDKLIGTSLEARLLLCPSAQRPGDGELLAGYLAHLPAFFIVSQVELGSPAEEFAAEVLRARGAKCERCWNYSVHVGENSRYPTVCERCSAVLDEIQA